MNEWIELYHKSTNEYIGISNITIHIKNNMVINQLYNQITMIVGPTKEDAHVTANALVIMYKSLDDFFSTEEFE